MADLRSYIFLDSLQPQVASFFATVSQGFLPIAGQASLFVEISPGMEINRVTDVALKSTKVTPGMQIIERLYGMLEIHSESQADVRQAGAAILQALDLKEEDWDEIIETNLTGTLRACQIFGRHMLEREYGRIINIASLSSFVALHEVAAYSASKAAVASLTKSLAVEWAQRGVCVNAIAPGVFRTALNDRLLDETERGREFLLRTPMRRFGNVEELAGVAVFLASDAASFVTGEIIAVDGGFLASGVNQ